MKRSTFNGCVRSNFTVTPGNWNTLKASLRRPWRITYRFYDPAFRHNPKLWGKQFAIRRMNDYSTLAERQEMTGILLEDERKRIDVRGYNPITGLYMAPKQSSTEIDILSPTTPFIRALELTIPKTGAGKRTKQGIANVVKFFGQSANMLGHDRTPLREIKRGDIMAILDNCANLTKTVKAGKEFVEAPKVWNDYQYNYFCKYLSILYTALSGMEIVEYNLIFKIPRKEDIRESEAPRLVLTHAEQIKVDEHLRAYPTFRRFLHIFFPSGTREEEIMRVQGRHVDLTSQRVRMLVKKRKKKAWVNKTITDTALPYWREVMQNCGPDDYVFSRGLVPGPKPIRAEQITKRWKRLVKDKLGIKADFYSLKHLYTTQIMDEMGEMQKRHAEAIKKAAEHNDHTSGAMVVEIYDTKQRERVHAGMKGMGCDFGEKAT